MTNRYFPLITLLVALMLGCSGPKALYKKGSKLELAGHYAEAANYYYLALDRKPDFPEAQIALKNTGERVMSQKMSLFFEASQNGQKREAIYTFREAVDFKQKLEKKGIELSIPGQYSADYEIIKSDYLSENYELGLSYMDEKQYEAAEAIFKEIELLEPNYKDSKQLGEIAYIEPYYIKGMNAMDEGHYRTAYYAFDEVCIVDDGYKNADELKADALSQGMVTIGLIGFENGTSTPDLEKRTSAFILNALSKIEDPFCKVIDRTNMDQILASQEMNLSGIVDESTAAEAGKLLGVKYLLGGTVLQISENKGDLKRLKKWGYNQIKTTVKNEETGEDFEKITYQKTAYFEYNQTHTSYVSVQMKIISLTTGEVLTSDILSKESTSSVHYCTFAGNAKNLYPEKEGGADTRNSSKKNLDALFEANQKIRSVGALTDESFMLISQDIKTKTENFSYQHVK